MTLYRLRVTIPLGQTLTAVFAAMSVQWTVARAVGCGLWKESLPFMRTAKGGTTRKGRRLRGLLGRRHGRIAVDRRGAGGHDQLQADPRAQHLRGRADRAEPAVHRRGGGRR